MKSGLACCLSAFSYAAQKSISTPPRRTLKLICTVDEKVHAWTIVNERRLPTKTHKPLYQNPCFLVFMKGEPHYCCIKSAARRRRGDREHASYKITGNRPYVEKDEHSPLLRHLHKICCRTTGVETIVSCFPGYTDTAVIAGTLHNTNCMSYGPGNLECAHQPDEWVAIKDILRCETVYKRLADLIF